MGMFDNLTSDYPLPAPAYQGRLFQTKDLDCQLDDYRIAEDGQLWVKRLQMFTAHNEDENSKEVQVNNLNNFVDFYDTVPDSESSYGGWVEFRAFFVNGKLQEIYTITDTNNPSHERPERYFLRVTYEIPPTRAVKTAQFVETAMSTEELEKLLQDEQPTWKILKIERGLLA